METTFYNKTGKPQIYLSTDYDNSFYTWEGHAVAYLHEDKAEFNLQMQQNSD